MKKRLVIGVTGGIATGKSEVLKILNQAHIATASSDTLAHECLRKGSKVYRTVVARFGTAVLDAQKEIHRPSLAAIVFAKPAQRRWLESVVHPCVVRGLKRFMRTHRGIIVLEIPLLFEAHLEKLVDLILVVSSSRSVQLERLRTKGFSRAEAQSRITAQWPLERKESLANSVVYNNGSRSELKKRLRILQRVWAALCRN